MALSWKEGKEPISYYLVAYGTEPGKLQYGNPNIGGKGTTGYVVENLSGGQTYYFRVRAGNSCTPGDFSNEIAATPIGFSEEEPATGFKENVLGVKTEKEKPARHASAGVAGGDVKAAVISPTPPINSQTNPLFVTLATLLTLSAVSGGIFLKIRKF